jgi:glycosyltransferase involved in cell wall biosynthesis
VLVDGRVLDDDHPGVRRFWVPILSAWASQGGCGLVAHRREREPDAALIAAGFSPIELHHSPYDPRGILATRRIVRQSAATATLSPLYLTLDGAVRNLATVFDLIGRLYPRSFSSRLLWEAMMWRTTRASQVICATTASGNDLVQAFPRLRGNVAIVNAIAPASGDDARLAGHARLSRPYALVIASNRPHKRLDLLASAWRASGSEIPLVMIGRGTERLHAAPAIQGLGFVSDDDVDAWLAGAACFLSASLEEGFGLPVLAALKAGVPVAAARVPSLEEVAGDAVVWTDTDDVAGLVRAAQELVADPSIAGARIERGRRRARAFTATRSARQLAGAIGDQ